MKNKNILLFFTPILFLFFLSFSFQAMTPPGFGQEAPSLEELDAFVKELTLETFKMQKGRAPNNDQELQDFELELQKMGEQVLEEIIEEGKKSGKSEAEALDSFFADLLGNVDQLEQTAPEKESDIIPKKPAQKAIKPEEISNVKDLLNKIIEMIHDFRIKVASNKQMRDNLLPYKYRFEDLIYLLHVLDNEQLIATYLTDSASKPLTEKLNKLYVSLGGLEPRFAPSTEMLMDTTTPYEILDVMVSADADEIIAAYQQKMRGFNTERLKKNLIAQGVSDAEITKKLKEAEISKQEVIDAYEQLRSQEEAKYLFEAIVKVLDDAIEGDKIIDEIKTVLEKYKKDASTTIKEREKTEKEARDLQEKALRTRPLLYPLPEKTFHWPPASTYTPSYSSSYTPSYPSYTPADLGKTTSTTTSTTPNTPAKSPSFSGASGTKKSEEKDDSKKDKEKEPSGPKKTGGESKKSTPDKPALDKDIEEKLIIIKDLIKEVDNVFMENFNELRSATEFMTEPFANLTTPTGQDQLTKAIKIKDAMTNLTAQINMLSKRVKKEIDGFKKKPEKAKAFKAAVKTELEKLEKKIEGTYKYSPKELKTLKDKNISDPNKSSSQLMCLMEKLSPTDPKGIPIIEGGDRTVKKAPTNDKKYFFFGIEEGGLPPATKSEIEKSNPLDSDGKTTNFVELLQTSYKGLLDLVAKKP